MSRGSSNDSGGTNWTVVLMVGVAVALVIAYLASPEESTVRKSVANAPSFVNSLPERSQRLKAGWRERLDRAKESFRGARRESEAALLGQLQEAKKQGWLGSN